MTEQQSTIAPPPSLGDILEHSERIGTVDFSHRLTPQPPAPVESPEDTRAEEILEDTVPAAPVERNPAERTSVEHQPDGRRDRAVPPVAAESVVEPAAQTPVHVEEQPESAEYEAPLHPAAPHLLEDTMIPPYVEGDPAAAGAQATALLSLVPAEDLATVGESFDDVVDAVLSRIRAAETATVRHLVAVEEEAARRCEMVTAQAELDAELIRLHARREAHAIIAASRLRAGESIRPTPDEAGLHQLGDAAGRLAEKLESLGVGPEILDHPFLR